MKSYRVREMICNHPGHEKEAEQLLVVVRAKLNPDADPAFNLTEAVVVALANDFDASITSILADQWFGVYAKKDDGSFEARIECDTVELGLAGVYRAFERHAKIMAVLAAIPDATWMYAVGDAQKDSIGHWTLQGVDISLHHDESVDPRGRAAIAFRRACLDAGFTSPTVDAAPTTSLRCATHRGPTNLVGHAGDCSMCGRKTDDAADHLCAACAKGLQRCQRCADPLTPQE